MQLCNTLELVGAINPSSGEKEPMKSLLRLPSYLHPVRRIFISISRSPQYRHVRDVWRKLNGYHFGVMCCAWTSAVVLLINLTATIWGVRKSEILDGLGTFQVGDCNTTSGLGFWLHLIINGLSTLLLGASNYSMQCLSSPTRSEIDRAHRKHIWLDIGIPSVKNLQRISWSRIVFWWALAISSVPLHLFWNSAVLSTLYSRAYYVLVVPADFPARAPFDSSNNTTYQQLASNASTLERLEPRACLEAYVGSINSNRGDVVLVSSYNTTGELPANKDISEDISDTMIGPIMPGFPGDPFSGPDQWICAFGGEGILETCDVQSAASNVSSWLFKEWDVQYVRPILECQLPIKIC